MKVRVKVYEPSMEGVQTARIHTLEKGATVKGLLKKDGYAFDKHKEYIIDFDTGETVQLNILVENKKTYVIIQKSDTERIIDLLEDILDYTRGIYNHLEYKDDDDC